VLKCKIIIKDTKVNEYVETITPYSTTAIASSALTSTVTLDPWDDIEVENFATSVFTKLIKATDSADWILEISNEDTDEELAVASSTEEGIMISIAGTVSAKDSKCVRRFCMELSEYASTAILDLIARAAKGLALKTATAAASGSATSATVGAESEDESITELVDKIRKTTKADIVKPKETLSDYVCEVTLKEELQEIVDFFENAENYKSVGIKIPKGILFKGVPGTGKTYAARCIAGTVDCYFMVCTASALQGMYVGSGAENIRQVFKGAKALRDASKKGVILFLDELDSFGSRDSHKGGAGSEEDRTLNQLLAEMSGFEDEDGIMILGATNYPVRLDDAMMRSGRFSRQITIEKPESAEREHLLEYYFNKITMPLTGTDCTEICELTKGFTPADIQEMTNEAAILSVRQKISEITLQNVNEAINKIITKNIRRPDKPDMLPLVAVHEMGHVLAEILYLNSIPVKVTNYSYGDAGGFTQPAASFTGIIREEQLKGHVMSLLGGRAAEEAVFGMPSTGASEDLRRAKRIIRNFYETYHFDLYTVKELEQEVVNTLQAWLTECIEAFQEPTNAKILNDLTAKLKVDRVMYSADIAAIASTLITF
jgi:ATP-dependent Zn protease